MPCQLPARNVGESLEVLDKTIEILERLVGFPSISGLPNLDLIDYVKTYLEDHGIACSLSYDETGTKANLYATIGPEIDGGVVLNGHTDVVPVEGQSWSSDPFILRRDDGKLYGRGAVDMKGFLACALAMVPRFKDRSLERPIHFSICYDEENGGFGAPVLVADIKSKAYRPSIAIIGEPTGMQIVGGHKGAIELATHISGLSGHASNPELGVNAIFYATRFISKLMELDDVLRQNGPQDCPFHPPYSTISVGLIKGGAARNIIANECSFDWEIRLADARDGDWVLLEVEKYVKTVLLPQMQAVSLDTSITTNIESRVPPLDFGENIDAIDLLRSITGKNSVDFVAFATDAGHFHQGGISTVVFGPGHIREAHMPDEFIEEKQMLACLDFLDRLADKLCFSKP